MRGGNDMKKTDKETSATRKLQFSGETIRVLRPSDLQHVAGGTSNESTENSKRPL
jgi:hypothetical protein